MTGTRSNPATSTLAIDGGTPVRTAPIGRWPEFGKSEEDLLLEALRSGVWGSIDGTFVKQFEREFAAVHHAKHGVATVNATMGLSVAMKAVGVGPGDEVLVPPYTFIATASAALMLGAIPVFVDVDPETLTIDPSSTMSCPSGISRSIARRSACRGRAARSISGRPNTACSSFSWSGRAGCSRASSCSTPSGATTSMSRPGPSTSI